MVQWGTQGLLVREGRVMKNSYGSQTQLRFPAFDPKQNCGILVCFTKSQAAQPMGSRSKLEAVWTLEPGQPPLQLGRRKAGLPSIHHCPPQKQTPWEFSQDQAPPGWAVRVGGVSWCERLGKATWASSLHPAATHTTLSKHTRKSML